MAWTMHAVFHIKNVGFGPLMLVLMGTLSELSIMCFEVPTGVLADLKSRKLSSVIGWFVVGIGFLIEGFFPVTIVVIIAQLILGLGQTFVSGAHDAWIVDEVAAENMGVTSGDAFLQGQQSAFVGRLAGTWLSIIFSLISLPAVMIVSGIGYLVFAVAAFGWMKEDGFKPSTEQRQMWIKFREGWSLVRRSKALLLVLCATVDYGFAAEGFDKLWNKTIIDTYDLPKVGPFGDNFWWPLLSSLAILGGMVLNKWLQKRLDTSSSKSILTAMIALTCVLIFSIIGFALSQTLIVTALLFVLSRTIRRGLEPLLKTWTNLYAPSETRATILSFASQSHGVGEIVGGPIAGVVGQYRSAKLAVVVAATFLLPVLPVLFAAKKNPTQSP